MISILLRETNVYNYIENGFFQIGSILSNKHFALTECVNQSFYIP